MRKLEYRITGEESGRSVGEILKKQLKLTEREIRHLKYQPGGIELEGEHVRVTRCVREGEWLRVCFRDNARENVPERVLKVPPLASERILYEDQDLLVVDKPAGISLHPGHGHYGDTLADQVLAYLQSEKPNLEKSPARPVGRLDKDTSGLVVFARSAPAAARLSGRIHKEYTAFAHGLIRRESFTVDLPLSRDPACLNRMRHDPGGLRAVTHVRQTWPGKQATRLQVTLETGRTHQIRVHLALSGHPLLGDPIYAAEDFDGRVWPRLDQEPDRAALHCGYLRLQQPFTGDWIELTSELPEDLKRLEQV
ncbi:MAG: RluA family pseudouridine synthase [Lachnospiraceae bacterium]|nr:RluA family pseudouridine synthase [Lachnospiraceae bacterium]